jgi:iron complex outermembrane recepter protein
MTERATPVLPSIIALGLAASALPAAAVEIDIPAQPLSGALAALGRQADLQILYDPELVRGRTAGPVGGDMEPAEALAALLAGTGVAFEIEDGAAVLGPPARDPQALPAITVEGRREEGAPLPADGIVIRRSSAATRTDTPIGEVPQAVSTIGRIELNRRGVEDVNAALAYTPGVRVVDYPGGQGAIDVHMRGIRQSVDSVLIDGLRSGFNPYGIEYEVFGLERIDVARGPSSAAYGPLPPGGMISLTSKRPPGEPLRRLQLQGGSFGRSQVTLDVGGPIGPEGTAGYRLTALHRDSGTQIGHVPDDRLYLAPALSWRNDGTELTLLLSYLDFRKMGAEQSFPASGTVRDNPNGSIDSDLFLGYPGLSGYQARNVSLGYGFGHALGDGWTLRQNLRYARSRVRYVSNWAYSGELEDDRYFRFGLQDRPKISETLLVDGSVEGHLSSGPLRHTLLAGLDHARYEAHETRRNGSVAAPIDVFAPVHGGPYRWDEVLQRDMTDRIGQTGLYLQDQIALDRWSLTLGGRWDRVETRSAGILDGDTPVEQSRQDSAFTGRAGLSYRFANGLSPYLGYSTSFLPNPDTDAAGRPFSPTRGEQYEVGIRYQPEGPDAVLSLSLFDLTQRNLATGDPDNPGFPIQAGEVRSRGVELEAKASLEAAGAWGGTWDLTAGYTYTDAEVTGDDAYPWAYPRSPGREGSRVASVPRHSASFRLDRRFAEGPLAGLGIGAGLRHVGATWNATNTIEVPGYTLVDAVLRYDLGRLGRGLEGAGIAVTATNLFDRKYFAPGFYENSVFFGNRRTILGTFTYSW